MKVDPVISPLHRAELFLELLHAAKLPHLRSLPIP